MKVTALLNHFKNDRLPVVSAAAAIGVYPSTIKDWEKKKKGIIPEAKAYMISGKLGIDLGSEDYK